MNTTELRELDQLSRKKLRELRSRIAELEDTERYRMTEAELALALEATTTALAKAGVK